MRERLDPWDTANEVDTGDTENSLDDDEDNDDNFTDSPSSVSLHAGL